MITYGKLYRNIQEYRRLTKQPTAFPLDKYPTPAALGERVKELRAGLARQSIPDGNAAVIGANLFADALDAMRLLGAADVPTLPKFPGDRAELLRGLDAIVAWCEAQTPEQPDETAWVAASILQRQTRKTLSAKQLRKLLSDHPEIRHRRPRPNRLEVHAGDWAKHWAGQDAMEFDALDRGEHAPITPEPSDEVAAGVLARFKEVQARKKARK